MTAAAHNAEERKLELLSKVSIFEGLSKEELGEISHLETQRSFPKNSLIFMEGETGKAFYYVKSGLVKIYKLTPDGKEQILAVWGPPELFGAVILLDRGSYPANAETLANTTVGAFDIDAFQALLEAHPDWSGRVMQEVAARLRNAYDRIRDLALRDVKSRLAGILIDMAEKHGSGEGDTLEFSLELTHQQLANLIGASRETVTRAINDFRDLGALEPLDGGFQRIHLAVMEDLIV